MTDNSIYYSYLACALVLTLGGCDKGDAADKTTKAKGDHGGKKVDAKTDDGGENPPREAGGKCADAATAAYQNAVGKPPADWKGPVFELSHNYPKDNPGKCPKDVCTWLSIPADFNDTSDGKPGKWGPPWSDYLKSVKDYVSKGQTTDLDNAAGWSVEVDGKTQWFHVPWMAYDLTTGREFVHGFTNERTASLSDFVGEGTPKRLHSLPLKGESPRDKPRFETWAFGVYNPWGGWSFGRAFDPEGVPHTSDKDGKPVVEGLPFPEGTVVAKLLFSTASPEDVPYLEGSPQWTANRHVETGPGKFSCERKPQPVHLVQMDIAVVDLRSPTRWVYGTFAYNGNIESDNAWDRLAPVGIQWAMDPWTFPAVAKDKSVAAHQSVLNTDIGIFEHEGCNGRLAGPVDNKESSCMSCHGSGFAPADGTPINVAPPQNNVPPIFGFNGLCTEQSPQNGWYFSNRVWPQPYGDPKFDGELSMDTSLQMWVAFGQWGQCNTHGAAAQCTLGGS